MPRNPTLTAEERQANRKAYMLEYYKTRRTEILQKRLTKHDCEICFGAYTPAHRAEHLKSPKHQRAVMLRSRNKPTAENEPTPEPVSS